MNARVIIVQATVMRRMESHAAKTAVRREMARRSAAGLARRVRDDTPQPSTDVPKSVGKLCATACFCHFLLIESGGISRASERHATCKGYHS
jgi:hypothetical protein